jgi:hypothetical protein
MLIPVLDEVNQMLLEINRDSAEKEQAHERPARIVAHEKRRMLVNFQNESAVG